MARLGVGVAMVTTFVHAECTSFEVDAAARQLLARMTQAVADHHRTLVISHGSAVKPNVMEDGLDAEHKPVELWADTLQKMRQTLLVSGFDFAPGQPNDSAEEVVSKSTQMAGRTKTDASETRAEDVATADALTVSGLKHGTRGEWAVAVPYFVQATETNPSKAERWLNLGLAQRRTGHRKAAEVSFERGLVLDSTHSTLRRNLDSIKIRPEELGAVRTSAMDTRRRSTDSSHHQVMVEEF